MKAFQSFGRRSGVQTTKKALFKVPFDLLNFSQQPDFHQILGYWSPERDSNSHGFTRRILNPLRLPFRHPGELRSMPQPWGCRQVLTALQIKALGSVARDPRPAEPQPRRARSGRPAASHRVPHQARGQARKVVRSSWGAEA